MGSSPVIGEPNTSKMKILLFIGAFVAAVLADPEPVADPSAEANADPWYSYYGGLGHYGYGYGLGYGYGSYYGGYRPYSYWGRKKRSAEAEPEPTADPNADPWYRYGYYGRPYAGYGYYGHRLGYYGGRYGYGYWG